MTDAGAAQPAGGAIVTVVGASGAFGSEIVARCSRGERTCRHSGYVSDDPERQERLFGDLPTVDRSVSDYCRDRGLIGPSPAGAAAP